jgi:hypothetical protein
LAVGNITFYIEVWVRKEREALLVANSRSEPIFPASNSPAEGVDPPPPNRRLLYQAEPLSPPPKGYFFRAGSFPKVPLHRCPPCVFRSPALFSACSQHTGSPACVWCVCRPLALFSAIAHCRRTSSVIGLHSVFTFVSAVPRSGFIQRTGYSACGLGHPHQVWLVGSPHVHSSCLTPVTCGELRRYVNVPPPAAPPGSCPGFCPLQVCINGYLSQKKGYLSQVCGSPTGSRSRSFVYSFYCSRPPPWWWLALRHFARFRPHQPIGLHAPFGHLLPWARGGLWPLFCFRYNVLYKIYQTVGGFPKVPALLAALRASRTAVLHLSAP